MEEFIREHIAVGGKRFSLPEQRRSVKGLTPLPKLDELMQNPAAVNDLPPEVLPGLRGKLAELDTLLLARLMSSANGKADRSAEGERLLKSEEAAAKLAFSVDELYRHADEYPFTVRQGHRLRFSEQGIDKWIRERAGRTQRAGHR